MFDRIEINPLPNHVFAIFDGQKKLSKYEIHKVSIIQLAISHLSVTTCGIRVGSSSSFSNLICVRVCLVCKSDRHQTYVDEWYL